MHAGQRTLAVVILLLLPGCGDAPSPATPERVARDVLAAFQRGDVEAYVALCSNRDDVIELIEGADRPEAEKAKARGALDRHVKRNDEERRENFADLLPARDWARVRFVGVESTPLEELHGVRGHQNVWVHLAGPGDSRFVLEIDAVVLLNRGWLIMDDMALALKARIPENRGRPRPAPLSGAVVSEAPHSGARLERAPEATVADVAESQALALGPAPKTPDALVREVVRCLQRGDLQGFLAVCGWGEDVEAILETLTLDEEMRAKSDKEIRENIHRLPTSRRSNFRRILGRNEWSSAQVGKIKLRKRVAAEFARSGAEQVNAEVEIEGPSRGTLYIRVLFRAPRGWVVMDDTPLSWNPDTRAPVPPDGSEPK